MALIDERKDLAKYIEDKKHYLSRNAQLFDIYEGNLKPYVDKILRETLSQQYYSKIKSRIYPINILRRLIDKMSKAYSQSPIREASEEQYQEVVEAYEKTFLLNQRMNTADEFKNLFRGYALEPFVHEGMPQLRVLPFDRFLVKSDDILNPLKVTHFLKHIGKKKDSKDRTLDVWFVYTKDEFMAMDQEGNLLKEYMVENEGVNPFGFIPFFYSGCSQYNLLPIQDTDTLELAKLLPVQLTDLAGAIMFQCFSIVYGIDVDSENMVMSPNAFWSFKSDLQSDKTPEIGTLKPEADIDKVMGFIKETFATWLETKGIRVGSLGSTDGLSSASGVSKMIDEMDTFESVKRSIEGFKSDEYRFWQLIKNIHNKWIEFGEIQGVRPLPDDFEVFTEFKDPTPMLDRSTEIDNAIKQLDAGLISERTALKNLYPDWTEEDIDRELKESEEMFGTLSATETRDHTEDNEVDGASEILDGVSTQVAKDLTLNGAQVTSLVEVVQQVAQGLLPRESGVQIIMRAFTMSRENAELLMGESGRSFKVTVAE